MRRGKNVLGKITALFSAILMLVTSMPVHAAGTTQIIPLPYAVCDKFSEGVAVCITSDWKNEVLMDTNGNVVATRRHSDGASNWYGGRFHEGVIGEVIQNRNGNIVTYRDIAGNTLITLPSEYASGGWCHPGSDGIYAGSSFYSGRAIIYYGDSISHQVGAIDKSGNLVIPCEYYGMSRFFNGYAIVAKNNKMGLIDVNGNVVVPLIYEWGWNIGEGFAFSRTSQYWTLKDQHGLWFVLDVNKGNSCDIFDSNGQKCASTSNTVPRSLMGKYLVSDSPLYTEGACSTIRNRAGEVLYTSGRNKGITQVAEDTFFENSVGQSVEGKLIDVHGNVISNHSFVTVEEYTGNYAVAMGTNRLYGVIDRAGNEVVPFAYQSPMQVGSESMFSIENNSLIMKDAASGTYVLIKLP